MNQSLRILFILSLLFSLAACGRRQEAIRAIEATRVAATVRASGGQPPAPVQEQPVSGQPAPGQDQPQPQPDPPAASGTTDLAVTNIKPSDSTPQANQSFEVAVSFQNLGPDGAPSFRWQLIPDYRPGGPNTVSVDMGGPKLGADGKIIIRADALYTAPGTYTMRALVNPGGNPNDPDSSNDYREIQITVGGEQGGGGNTAPDLAVTKIKLSKDNPAVNERIEVAVTIKNAGTAPAVGFTWGLFADYQSGGNNLITSQMGSPDLSAGESMTIRQDVTYASAGNHTLAATANLTRNPADANPNNDLQDISLTVSGGQSNAGGGAGGSPFLSISSHRETPAEFQVGKQISFKMKIRNEGSGPAGPFTWAIFPCYVEGDGMQAVLTGVVPGLAPGATVDVSTTFTYKAPGTCDVRFNPDVNNMAGSANNWLQMTYPVTP